MVLVETPPFVIGLVSIVYDWSTLPFVIGEVSPRVVRAQGEEGFDLIS